MKKKLLILLCALASVALLASCSDTLTFTYDSGKLVDAENGITYVGASLNIEPVGTSNDMYAKSGNIELYTIEGMEPSLWLSRKYEGIGAVYYAEGAVTPPDLEGFEANRIVICKEEVNTVGIAHVELKADVDAVIAAFINGEDADRDTDSKRYKLKFASDKYSGLYYALEYYQADNGENHIFDRNTGVCKNVGDVLEKYLPG